MKIIISILLLALFLFNGYSIGAAEVEKLNAKWTRLLNIKNALEEEEFSVNPKQEIAAPLLLEMARYIQTITRENLKPGKPIGKFIKDILKAKRGCLCFI